MWHRNLGDLNQPHRSMWHGSKSVNIFEVVELLKQLA